jgi:UDP-N-acetylglucosamine 2-epimerase (non-hydrolysing)
MAGRLSVFVVGTRAQLIKVAPAVACCEAAGQRVLLLRTGQHQETMQDLVVEFGLGAPQESVSREGERATVGSLLRWLPAATAGLVRRLRQLRREQGAINVVVHGDTLSTLLGAFAGRCAGARVFHLESGLSSGRLFDPFPEELTRRLVFRMTDVALCPGPASADYMRSRHRCQVVDTGGNTIVDAVMLAARARAGDGEDVGQPYLVASLHRFQNIYDGERLRFLVDTVTALSESFIVHFVLHPATRKRLAASGALARLEAAPGVRLSPRLGYGRFLRLAAGAECVLTDGGSNQEELAVLGVPTLVMRQHTERPDGLGHNAVMEGDLGQGVLEFLRGGGHRALRRESAVGSSFGPSRRVAELLAGADGEAPGGTGRTIAG